MSIDLSRQAAMIPGDNVRRINALIIGVGSIGSNAAHVLASVGVERMTLVDGDKTGPENLGPAFLSNNAVHPDEPEFCLYKTHDVSSTILDMLGEAVADEITTVDQHFTADTELPDAPYNLVIVGTDNLESRRLAWNQRESIVGDVGGIWVDGRMGGQQLSMYAVDTRNFEMCTAYANILFNGTPPPPLPCGMKATAALTKGFVPGFVGQIVYNMVNDIPVPYMQMHDLGDATHVTLPTEGEFYFDELLLDAA